MFIVKTSSTASPLIRNWPAISLSSTGSRRRKILTAKKKRRWAVPTIRWLLSISSISTTMEGLSNACQKLAHSTALILQQIYSSISPILPTSIRSVSPRKKILNMRSVPIKRLFIRPWPEKNGEMPTDRSIMPAVSAIPTISYATTERLSTASMSFLN